MRRSPRVRPSPSAAFFLRLFPHTNFTTDVVDGDAPCGAVAGETDLPGAPATRCQFAFQAVCPSWFSPLPLLNAASALELALALC
jgi:hypothetical protein